jgi:hypothetical protein
MYAPAQALDFHHMWPFSPSVLPWWAHHIAFVVALLAIAGINTQSGRLINWAVSRRFAGVACFCGAGFEAGGRAGVTLITLVLLKPCILICSRRV